MFSFASHNAYSAIILGECGICANAETTIEVNQISNAGHELIDIHNHSPIIRGNHLGPNKIVCIVVERGSPEITANVFEGCGAAIAILNSASTPIIEDNEFIANDMDFYYEN